MKIVLKELVNGVGLPTGRLTCALTTYMGFGRATLVSAPQSAHHSNSDRRSAASALAMRGHLPECPRLSKDWRLGRCPSNVCALRGRVYIGLAKPC